ncbi:MAG: hypothetical protein GZ094_21985 [Mariniphaga sp.]|nr:hypothetical protein [Mariniphaga sp.]
MKKLFFILIIVLICFSSHMVKGSDKELIRNTKVLVLPLLENVSSNYYPLTMIAQDMKVKEDSIVAVINNMVAENISENNSQIITDLDCKGIVGLDKIQQQVKLVDSSSDVKIADLSAVSERDYSRLIEQTGVGYVVFINGYYINKRDKPFNTVFHTISLSIFDSKKNKVFDFSNYYNTFDLVPIIEMKAASRKCVQKMAQTILRKANKS